MNLLTRLYTSFLFPMYMYLIYLFLHGTLCSFLFFSFFDFPFFFLYLTIPLSTPLPPFFVKTNKNSINCYYDGKHQPAFPSILIFFIFFLPLLSFFSLPFVLHSFFSSFFLSLFLCFILPVTFVLLVFSLSQLLQNTTNSLTSVPSHHRHVASKAWTLTPF